MKVTSIKTEKIIPGKTDIFSILDKHVKSFSEKSILAVTSKIVSICEGRVISTDEIDRDTVIQQEAEYYLPREMSKYNSTLTIKRNLLVPAAGVDESNGDGYFILWPKDPQKTANEIRSYLKNRFVLQHVGVIITDSKTTPLRWGTTGVSLSQSGFAALKNYIGEPDIFGKNLKMTKANITDALAIAAVLTMGEGNEQTPLAVLEDLPFVEFQNRNPSKKELQDFAISMEDDLYSTLLTSVQWKKGKAKV